MTSPKKFSFILYQDKQAPRYFEISKSMIHFVLFGFPIIALISLTALGVGGIYLKKVKSGIIEDAPEIISDLKTENNKLKKENKNQVRFNKQLHEKLASKSTEPLKATTIFRSPPGQTDISKKQNFTVENFRNNIKNGNFQFRFDLIIQATEQRKLSGYIFVIMKNAGALHFHPKDSMVPEDVTINFNRGESFAASRFRPVIASFPIPKSDKVFLSVLIFSRTGDLIYHQKVTQKVNAPNAVSAI